MLNKIMFFLPTLGGGGAERTVIQLANNLVQQGRDVDVVVCDLSGEKAKLLPEVDSKIQLIDLNCGRVFRAITPLKQLLKAVPAIAKRLAKSQSKLILREVSTPSKNMKLTGLKKFVFNRLVNWTYCSADQVVCVSNGVLEDFKQYYHYSENNLSTIYNPVIDSRYLQKLKAPVQHHFFSQDHQVVLAVGRLTEAKNFGLLIRSFKALYDQHADTRLIILGEGELRAEFEALITELGLNDVVDLPGFDPNPYAYFKYASLFVLSSNWEGLPGVLIQALASKVKVVSTDCPSGPREILAEGQFGLLVPCDDQKALSDAMHQAIYHNYVTFDADAFKAHCLQFHKDTVVRQYQDLLESKA